MSAMLGQTRLVPVGARVWSQLGYRRGAMLKIGLLHGSHLASGSRFASIEAGENKSGHIKAAHNEGVLFFTNVLPLRLVWLLRFPWQSEKSLSDLLQKSNSPIMAADPSKLVKKANSGEADLKVTQVLPRLKEGGAFVKFTHPSSITLTEIEESLTKYLKKKKLRPKWNPLSRVRAGLVRGKPWLEDLYRPPSSQLKVEFVPPESGVTPTEISQENLYEVFRPYGRLKDITPQPFDSKIEPRYATLNFIRIRRAILAKNCLHGFKIPESEGGGKSGTVLRISYERKAKGHWIWNWLMSHPRIVIPIFAAILATITVSIFDPIRTFFVKAHITRRFHVSDNVIYRWLLSKTNDILAFNKRDDDDDIAMEAIWDDRKDNIASIQKWLMETDDTFIIVQGPRGSGKNELVLEQALKNWKNKLIIDCKPIQEARGEGSTISAMALQTGYRPVFSWMNSVSGMVDLAAQGAAGVKTGFSETLDTQLQKILGTTAQALKNIALEGRKHDEKDAHLGDDEYLEAHPERRPVVVIDNFLYKSHENDLIYERLAEWAARVTSSDVAHVIFLTNDISYSKTLSKALPDTVFHQISLSDCSPKVAQRFVLSFLSSNSPQPQKVNGRNSSQEEKNGSAEGKEVTASIDQNDLDTSIQALGGRLTDLEFLARRILAGETPQQAVSEIVEQSSSEILKMFLSSGSDDRNYTPEQAWHLIKALASKKSLKYNEVLVHDLFKSGGESALTALEQAELISVSETPGTSRPAAIKPGRPVYLPAFKQLTQDTVLKAKLDLATCSELIKGENKSIEKAEQELQLLGKLPRTSYDVLPRAKWLLKKIKDSQDKVEAYEKEQKAAKKILGEAW